MSARVLQILARRRRDPIGIVRPHDFRTREQGTVSPSILVEQPNYTLYCLHFPRRTAWFVRTPAEIDLTAATFYYQAQYQHAEEIIEVDWPTFHQLAHELPVVFENLVLLYSVGRCGSTLLSQMFHQLPQVSSLSEPDVYTQLMEANLPQEEIKALLRSTTLWYGQRVEQPGCVLKFRAQCFRQAEWMQEIFPQAKCLFMYRHAEKFLRSAMRSYCHFPNPLWWVDKARSVGMQSILIHWHMRLQASVVGEYLPWIHQSQQVCRKSLVHFFTGFWIALVDLHLRLTQQISIVPFRYEEFVAQPEELFKLLLDNVEVSPENLSAALQVMEHDSQRDSEIARHKVRAWDLTTADRLRMEEVFAAHPTISGADYRLPASLLGS